MPQDVVRAALTSLRDKVRARDDGGPLLGRRSIAIPADRRRGEHGAIYLDDDAARALSAAADVVAADLRFEHLDKPEREVELFALECFLQPDSDLVELFVAEHGRTVNEQSLYVTVAHLTATAPITVGTLELLPLDHPDVPELRVPITLAPGTTVARIRVRGTSPQKMADRARASLRHQLMTLRIALRDHPAIHDQQLRFDVGEQVIFEGGAAGWSRGPGAAFALEMTDDLAALAESRPVRGVPEQPASDLIEKARLASVWMERARFTDDPLVALLFLFFALESLLGRKSDRMKAFPLAERQMALAHVMRGGFRHPDDTWLLYERVRSTAVHGEQAPFIDRRRVQVFEARVRESLSDFLELGGQQGIVKRARLLQYLDNHSDLPALREWLRVNADPAWIRFIGEAKDGSI